MVTIDLCSFFWVGSVVARGVSISFSRVASTSFSSHRNLCSFVRSIILFISDWMMVVIIIECIIRYSTLYTFILFDLSYLLFCFKGVLRCLECLFR